MSKNSKIILLIIVVVALVAGAVYIGYQQKIAGKLNLPAIHPSQSPKGNAKVNVSLLIGTISSLNNDSISVLINGKTETFLLSKVNISKVSTTSSNGTGKINFASGSATELKSGQQVQVIKNVQGQVWIAILTK